MEKGHLIFIAFILRHAVISAGSNTILQYYGKIVAFFNKWEIINAYLYLDRMILIQLGTSS
jgi:hypothetical protein